MSESVVVTGASSGLGLATAERLAAAGRHVILGCRSGERGAAAARSITDAVPNADVEVLPLDVASLRSVRAAAAELIARRAPLHALVLNAGVQVVDGVRRSADGFELTFATNHLGHFLLTSLLREHLAEPARIVVVSSGTHYGPPRSGPFPGPRWDDPRVLADPSVAERDPSPRAGRIRYANSKLANLYFAYELARRLAGRAVTVNAFDPGLMPQTRLDRDYSARLQRLYDRLTPLLIHLVPGANSVAFSSDALARLVIDDEVAGVTGAYFAGRKLGRSSRESHDPERAAQLWQASTDLVAAADHATS
jgi:NAD(P)-dependent dehydrogenase (short-subunit alcohol dehydrogenase family)